LYADLSSPTVATSAVFMIIALAAAEHRYIATMDIGGAYLNARLSEHEVYMRINKNLTAIILELKPEYEQFKCNDGSLLVRLVKALYGCVESSKLWYDHIASTLIVELQFTRSKLEHCVFYKISTSGNIIIICIHVDDLLITSVSMDDIELVLQHLLKKYKEVKISRGLKHSYLGMTFDFTTTNKVNVTMEAMIEDIIREYEVSGVATTPATSKLFDISLNSPLLSESKAADFHSRVAKLAYV